MRVKPRTTTFILGLALIAAAMTAETAVATALQVEARGTKTLYLNHRAGNNQVTFFSESTLEDFTGVCNQMDGWCTLDPQNVESFTGEFSLRVEDLKTGIELRDQHLRGPQWMEADRYPRVVVKIDRMEDVRRTSPNSVTATMLGTCTFHGKTSDARIEAALAYLDESPETMRRVAGDLIRIRAGFEVKLSEHGVSGPPGSGTIGLKVADTIRIKATVFGSTQPPPAPLKVDENAPSTQPAGEASTRPAGKVATRPAGQPASRPAEGSILKRPPPRRPSR